MGRSDNPPLKGSRWLGGIFVTFLIGPALRNNGTHAAGFEIIKSSLVSILKSRLFKLGAFRFRLNVLSVDSMSAGNSIKTIPYDLSYQLRKDNPLRRMLSTS